MLTLLVSAKRHLGAAPGTLACCTHAVGTFCFAGEELDRPAARRFVAAYRDAGGTAPREEEDLLVPLMRVKRILEVLRAPADRHARWEHQRHNLRALRQLA